MSERQPIIILVEARWRRSIEVAANLVRAIDLGALWRSLVQL